MPSNLKKQLKNEELMSPTLIEPVRQQDNALQDQFNKTLEKLDKSQIEKLALELSKLM